MHRFKDDVQIQFEALVVPKIPGLFPDEFLPQSTIPPNELADPQYHVPSSAQLLIGAGVWASIIGSQVDRLPELPRMVAQSTSLGLVIFGQSKHPGKGLRSFHLSSPVIEEDMKLDQLLLRYWNADEIPTPRKWTAEEEAVEANFIATHQRSEDGRYIVSIPRRTVCPPLGNSYSLAKACFLSVERKMEKNPDLKRRYKEIFDDYRSSGHMIEAPPFFGDPKLVYYMPHHPINYDPKTAKGKFRGVFNASAKSANGTSFNDQQLPGPKLQSDLIEIFLRFRLWKYGMTADIKQMFRQVLIALTEYNFQRILWRDEPHHPLKQYFITVVSWGMTSAGYNAVRALRQCAIDGQVQYPLGAEIALNDFYFDDMLSGAATEHDLILRQIEVLELLKTAGFDLSKWSTNSPLLAKKVGNSNGDVPLECGILGMKWAMGDDLLCLNTLKFKPIIGKITPRAVASAIAQLYDPSGLALPVIVSGKILQQKIWKAKLGWDQELTPELKEEWFEYAKNIQALEHLRVPRWLEWTPKDTVELHVFADSSELAMGASAYLVTHREGEVHANLITSRSKVAPTKKVPIPKLELSAAVLAAKLAKFVRRALRFNNIPTFFWTDSTIACQWIQKDPLSLTSYVANRVTTIHELSEMSQWRHVPGVENPADLLTRGASTETLINSTAWWHGPPWLKLSQDTWPSMPEETMTIPDPEEKIVAFIRKSNVPTIEISKADVAAQSLLNSHSNIDSLMRVTAYVLRFITILKRKIKPAKINSVVKSIPYVTVQEHRLALKFWIKHTQALYYSKEIENIIKSSAVDKGSSIAQLTPWLDEDHLLRVTGRLQLSNLPFNTKHQIIIPPESRLANLLVVQMHTLTLHGGPQLVMTLLRRTYWINRVRQIAKSVAHQCTKCAPHSLKTPEQLMGQLPLDRVSIGEPFACTGCDFAGPFNVKRRVGRPSRNNPEVVEKAWIAIFICLASRAVHIEVLFGLTVNEFLEAFERFTVRKGRCFKLKTDNGTTFVGSDNELARILQSWSKEFPMHKMTKFGTEWSFIPPAAPHKGGIWEAAVKSFKHHLKRIIGRQPLAGKALIQTAIQIEGCLNSRPLWPASDDPSDLRVITPADIFLGKPIISQPLAEYVENQPDNRLTWWQQRQKLHQKLWRQWQDDYLTTLQVRRKWYRIETNIKVNDMVIVREDNLPPTQWCVGRVLETFPDKEGLVRTVKIRTPSTELIRPITKLCIMIPPDLVKDPPASVAGGGASHSVEVNEQMDTE